MYEFENTAVMSPEEDLVDLLLDFIIVSANLAKNVCRTIKKKEGGSVNGQTQRIRPGNQGPAQRRRHH